MRHNINPETWRCIACREPAMRCLADPMCHPDDGASFVASLGERPSDTEPTHQTPDDPFFALTMGETYTTRGE